jgi:hypothetical protein
MSRRVMPVENFPANSRERTIDDNGTGIARPVRRFARVEVCDFK